MEKREEELPLWKNITCWTAKERELRTMERMREREKDREKARETLKRNRERAEYMR